MVADYHHHRLGPYSFNFRKALATFAENTIQGIRDRMEKTRPRAPAVEGITMRSPAASPQEAVARLWVVVRGSK